MDTRKACRMAAETASEPPIAVEITSAIDFGALSNEWRALEQRARSASIFQSWSWVGCLIEERFDRPVLIRAVSGSGVVGLALLNRRGSRLHLTESGDPVRDAPFIEHNGPLIAAGWEGLVLPAVLSAVWTVRGVRRLVLSGAERGVADACGGVILRVQERVAPCVDLRRVRAEGGDHLATLTANTRYQIRRSMRLYEASGPLSVRPAGTPAEVETTLEHLFDAHAATWRRRGKPGAFAHPFMRRFHHALAQRCLGEDRLDLLTIRAGERTIGYLYGFRHGGRVSAYQSGFMTDAAESTHAKPGLTCHALAIARALARGDAVYDFLAGDDRYKRSLANDATVLAWTEHASPRSPFAFAIRLARRVRRMIGSTSE